jgi:uncharacterized membrane protein
VSFDDWISLSARIMEGVGVGTTVVGAAVAAILATLRAGGQLTELYRVYRQLLGRAILLGLEFLIAADIIRTVSHLPTLTNVLVLGLVVVIRTFLSLTLTIEIEGTLPWKRKAPHGRSAGGG